MSKVFTDVHVFMTAAGQTATQNNEEQSLLYHKLINEEYQEFCKARLDGDDVETADACFDMIWVIVGLQTDPTIDRPDTKNKPVQSIVERYVQLSAVKFVDEIIVYDTEKDLEDLLMFLPITLRICGEEYKDKHLTGRDICDNRGIKTYYNSRTHRFSSSELRQRTYQSELTKKV